MATEPLQINLAVSLHAPNDELRGTLLPINQRYPVRELMDAIGEYIQRTNRRVTFEYAMMDGINDTAGISSTTCCPAPAPTQPDRRSHVPCQPDPA